MAWEASGVEGLGGAAVYGKLGPGGTLVGAVHVCRSWRRAAAHEPTLIRAGDDGLLLSLAERLSSLRILRLVSCYSISNEGFVEAIQKLTLLEELEISLCKNILAEAIEVIGKACPRLKVFRLSNDLFYCFEDEHSNNQEARGISTMRELRSLQLFGNNLNNQGLISILDNCRHLEFLDIRHCFNVHMDAALQAKCARIETFKLPDDSTADYEFPVKSPIRYCSNFAPDYVCEEHWASSKFEEDEYDYYYREFYPPEEDLIEPEDAPLGVETDRIVPFHIRFHIFKTNSDTDIVEYECGVDVTRIRMRIGSDVLSIRNEYE